MRVRSLLALLSLALLGANTPNMNLPIDTPGQTTGPQWASDQELAKQLIDAHDHSSGKGVKVTPAGLNINVNLPLNGNAATQVGSVQFIDGGPGPSVPMGTWTDGVDLWYEDGNGNKVKLTAGGNVNAGSVNLLDGGTFNIALNRLVLVATQVSSSPYSISATAGSSYYVAVTGASVLNLPAASALANQWVMVSNTTASNITVAPNGTDGIMGTNTAWTLMPGQTVHLVSSGTTNWWLE